MELRFRPHHFLCAFCFQGRGYSSAFIANFQMIVDALNDCTTINIVKHTDSICAPCPSKQGKLCASQDKITRLDTAHADALQITSTQQITWSQAKEKIAAHVSRKVFDTICAGCEWKQLGICEKVLENSIWSIKESSNNRLL